MGFYEVLISILEPSPFAVTGEISPRVWQDPGVNHTHPIRKTSWLLSCYYMAQMFLQPEEASQFPGGLLASALEVELGALCPLPPPPPHFI